ncbi:hypothetical protein EJD97_013292 [Solanum chilense]|uniref:Uncharacterized protein n=1 Tax=Solanum chilense TaxID=4083 RepID=A0A6N2CKY0_SOLCI|nr:hypothetical protein EJD97_013292 [Solanum chilense]
MKYCFVKLQGNAETTLLFRPLILFFKAQPQWNKRRSKTLLRYSKWTRRSSGLHFFVLLIFFSLFCQVVYMLSPKLKNLRLFINN